MSALHMHASGGYFELGLVWTCGLFKTSASGTFLKHIIQFSCIWKNSSWSGQQLLHDAHQRMVGENDTTK